MLKGTIKSLMSAAILATGAVSAQAADFTIRATANSNENDEDYDGHDEREFFPFLLFACIRRSDLIITI